MARKYDLKTPEGSLFIPVTNGTITTPSGSEKDMDVNFDSGVFVISFYNNGVLTTPTAGTVTVEMSPDVGQWLLPGSGDGIIDATEVIAGSATYTVPRFSGPAIAGRATFDGITGVDSAKAYFWRTRQNNNQ